MPSLLIKKALLMSNSCGGPAGNGWSFVAVDVGDTDMFTPECSANKY
jgi:hypothetical protein